MVQAQARAEDQAVQLHEKLEAKRAATHAEKVRSCQRMLCSYSWQAMLASISHTRFWLQLLETACDLCIDCATS